MTPFPELRTAVRNLSTDRRRTVLETLPGRCLGTTAQHTGRNLATYVVGIGAGRRLATICSGCFAVYQGMGAAIQPERRR